MKGNKTAPTSGTTYGGSKYYDGGEAKSSKPGRSSQYGANVSEGSAKTFSSMNEGGGSHSGAGKSTARKGYKGSMPY